MPGRRHVFAGQTLSVHRAMNFLVADDPSSNLAFVALTSEFQIGGKPQYQGRFSTCAGREALDMKVVVGQRNGTEDWVVPTRVDDIPRSAQGIVNRPEHPHQSSEPVGLVEYIPTVA